MSSITRPGGSGLTTGYQVIQGLKNFQDGLYAGAVNGPDADTVLTTSDAQVQIISPTAARTYTLPNMGFKKGQGFTFINQAAGNSTGDRRIFINSSAPDAVTTCFPRGVVTVVALVDDPAFFADWGFWSANDTATFDYVPIFKGGGSAITTADFIQQSAYFTRYGQVVYLHIEAAWIQNNSVGAGDFSFTLPLQALATPGNKFQGSVFMTQGPGSTMGYMGFVNFGASNTEPKIFYNTTFSGTMANLNLSTNFGYSGNEIVIDVTYLSNGV